MRRKSTTSEMMESYIVDSLLLLMKKKDFQHISIGEITEKAGVNRSTYYRHFNNKEDIILYFFDYISRTFLEQERTQELDFKEYLTRMYAHYFQHKEQLLTIYRNGLSYLFLKVLQEHLGKDLPKDCPASLQYDGSFYIGGMFSYFQLWFSRDMVDSPETMAQYTLEVLPEDYAHHIWGDSEQKRLS